MASTQEASPGTLNMDQDTARFLFHRCAVLVIAGVPKRTEFGIDLTSYQVDENFRGVKMIPDGVHYVYCASQGPYGDTAPRVGFIHYFKRGDVVIREWDPKKEELRERRPDQVAVDTPRIRENLQGLDQFLAPYDYDELSHWKNLTDHVDEATVKRLLPDCGLIRTSMEYLSCPDADRPRGAATSPRLKKIRTQEDEDTLLPALKPLPETAIKFTAVPLRCPAGATPGERSLHHMDCVEAVEKLLGEGPRAMLAEVQFAFVLFLCGYSTDALAHWRRILGLVSNSKDAVERFKTFYADYLLVIQYQLPELPVEMMEQSPRNTVYEDVRRLIANCIELEEMRPRAEHLRMFLGEKMSWTFEGLLDEDPEDQPVIVGLD